MHPAPRQRDELGQQQIMRRLHAHAAIAQVTKTVTVRHSPPAKQRLSVTRKQPQHVHSEQAHAKGDSVQQVHHCVRQ